MRRYAVSFALLVMLLFPGSAQMAIVTDATPVVQIQASPEQGGGTCGIYVAWENQGAPLVDHWDVRNTMLHSCLALLNDQSGAEIWRATVPASTDQTFVASQAIPGVSINWRRQSKQTIFSFGLSG